MPATTHGLIIAACVAAIVSAVFYVGGKVNTNCVEVPFFKSCSVSVGK